MSRHAGSKHDDLLSGALTVFAREGYTRATIAATANVSTRTVYNQYDGKAAASTLMLLIIGDPNHPMLLPRT